MKRLYKEFVTGMLEAKHEVFLRECVQPLVDDLDSKEVFYFKSLKILPYYVKPSGMFVPIGRASPAKLAVTIDIQADDLVSDTELNFSVSVDAFEKEIKSEADLACVKSHYKEKLASANLTTDTPVEIRKLAVKLLSLYAAANFSIRDLPAIESATVVFDK